MDTREAVSRAVIECIKHSRTFELSTEITEAILQAVEEDRAALLHDIDAYRGALGYPIPGDHNAKLTSGEQPVCGLCDAKEKILAKAEAREAALREVLVNIRPEFETGSWPANDIDAAPASAPVSWGVKITLIDPPAEGFSGGHDEPATPRDAAKEEK